MSSSAQHRLYHGGARDHCRRAVQHRRAAQTALGAERTGGTHEKLTAFRRCCNAGLESPAWLHSADHRQPGDEIKRRFEALLQPLVADGYARSEWPTRNICILNDAAAIVSGRVVRYR